MYIIIGQAGRGIPDGCLYLERYGRGGDLHASFSYHGFQYVEVESSRPVTLTEENLTGLFMHTDVRPSGSFACSNPLLNKIWEATMQAYRSNLHSIPTDCPQREKNGWTATRILRSTSVCWASMVSRFMRNG